MTVSSSACRAEGDLHLRAPASVPGRVGQRLLDDPVGGLVDVRSELPASAVDADVDGEPGGAVALGERVECGEARRRLDLAPVGGAVLAQSADELVDLAQRLAGDLLDRLERDTRPRRDPAPAAGGPRRPGRGSR